MASARDQASSRHRGPTRLAPVRRVTDEPGYLYRLIQTIGAGPDLDLILHGVVELVTEATECHACFIYFRRDAQLELRAASRMYEHLEGKVRMPIGEGLTGWVAKTRRSAHIEEGALDDPRVRRASFPELGDDVYQSLVSAPMFGRGGDVIGVITLHARAPYEFGRADLDFLEHTAALIGGAVENARLYEDAGARIELLSDLAELSNRIASSADQQEVIRVVSEGVRDLLDAASVQVDLLDADATLEPRASGAQDRRAAPGPQTADGGSHPSGPRRLATAAWDERTEQEPLAVPLVAGSERLGVLRVLLRAPRVDATAALASVAAHTAVALKQHQVIERLQETNLLKDFFRALNRSDASPETVRDLAGRVGCDLDAPHLALHVAPWAARASGRSRAEPRRRLPWSDLAGQVEARLAARFRELLIDSLDGSIRAILPLEDADAEGAGEALREMDWGDADRDGATIGVSDVCCGRGSFARGFDEARAAAEVGALVRGTPGVTSYEELGPYRYVLRTEDEPRDRSQEQLDRLVEYDEKRGTRLLDTLEAHLDHRGNVVATSRVLFIHPNTLRQRLDRIERLSGLDLERSDWLSLAVATKVVKLRRMRRAVEGEGRNDG
jgi:sugar diacid utilization regulator